jgi:uncharacterized protein
MSTLQWFAIFLAASTSLVRAPRFLTWGSLIVGYGIAFMLGHLGLPAAIVLALLGGTGFILTRKTQPLYRWIGHIVFVIIAIALFQHWIPGFHNLRVIHAERFTPDAAPFTMYLNFDKPLIGFWLLLVFPWIRPKHKLSVVAGSAAVALTLTCAVCLAIALHTGFVKWEPKWPHNGWLWALDNLLLVTFAEEALFRGYIQGGIVRSLKQRPYAQWVGLFVATVLFGLAHFEGGIQLVALAWIAGLGYGLAYRFGGLQSAMLTHFGLNLVQFGLFTYPMIAHG